MKQSYKCIIRTLSPVHIGCGDVYEPTGFVVDEKNLNLVQFEFSEFLASLNDNEKEQLSAICSQGNLVSILKLYKFFQGKKADGRKIDVTSEFVKHYKDTLKIPENNPGQIQKKLNRFIVERTAFRPWDNRPYLPGSSIKGALRTGYLNFLCKGQKIKGSIEKKLMNLKNMQKCGFPL